MKFKQHQICLSSFATIAMVYSCGCGHSLIPGLRPWSCRFSVMFFSWLWPLKLCHCCYIRFELSWMHFCSKEAIQKEIHHQGYFHLHEMKLEEGKGFKASMLPVIQVLFPIDWVSLSCKILEANWWSPPTIYCSVFKTILLYCGVYKHLETREYRIHAVKCANLQTWWRGMYSEVRCYQKQIHCVESLIKMNLNLLFVSKQPYQNKNVII